MITVTRRAGLLGLGTTLALGRQSLALAAAPTAKRLVVINIKGGLDGLSFVAPYGDPYLAKLRAPLLAGAVGTPGGMFDLGGFYGLHPAMPNLHAMFTAGQAMFVHAVMNCAATRSHFDGQDYLQSGAATLLGSGWLNRASALVTPSGSGLPAAIAVDTMTPLLLQGPTATAGWAPGGSAAFSPSRAAAILAASRGDAVLGPATSAAFADAAALGQIGAAWPAAPGSLPSLALLARSAGEFLAAGNGPRIAALETPTIDTHADQVEALTGGLSALDQALAQLQSTLGAAWSQTVVITITEFGRTAAMNGTNGTDHGTGFAMLLAGGAVAGGRVLSQWPGLSPSNLYQGRDLAGTVDVRSVLMGVLQQHLGISSAGLATVFPGAGGISPVGGVIRS